MVVAENCLIKQDCLVLVDELLNLVLQFI